MQTINSKKILIATPMMPPTLGGPAEHAKKIAEHFNCEIFNFESLNKYPAGIRHLFAFVKIFFKSMNSDIIFAFDGFSVALPSVIVGKILRKKVILRIGGDLVHEQYVENVAVDLQRFYEDLKSKKIILNKKLHRKLEIQKYVLKNSFGIVFTTQWQKNIYENFYQLPKKVFIINNPIEKINTLLIPDYPEYDKNKKIFISAARQVAFKNLHNLEIAFEKAQEYQEESSDKIFLDTAITNKDLLLSRLKSSRAYICASLSDISPNTVLDSLSLLTPVILTKNTGFYDLLKDENVARFIDPYDENDMRNAIVEMANVDIYKVYKQNVENFINQNKWPETWESLMQKYERIIDESV